MTCCFTGHRPQHFAFGFDETSADCLRIKAGLGKQIRLAAEEGYRIFVSGMALGVDLWAAESVLELREENPDIRLCCVLPCATQASRWKPAQRERYRAVLDRCDEAAVLRPMYTRGCMFERNRKMVERSSRVIAVYDGRKKGGTGFTVQLARRSGLEVVVLNPNAPERAEVEQMRV